MIRLRSILLTSGTTIVGLIPLLVSYEAVPWTVFGFELPFELSWMDDQNQDIWENREEPYISNQSEVYIKLELDSEAVQRVQQQESFYNKIGI